ncbi:Fe-S cluster assembly protein SufD [Acetobacter persici]|uniref:ABC transporter permease n=1 Tax=Acetobacter persici TaxID=1076596 RepID=A0A1U9LH17_9PROT|nr:Fe-S cluster assembly protein SufD [Acetobacter persici]AQT05702.1 ABC transporter permease [Acetobacter persici]
MNAITQDRSDTLAPFGTRLDGVTDPVRKAATGALHRSGLPDRRVEEWRYTSLRFLAETPLAAPADVYDVAQIQAQLEELGLTDGPLADLPRLVFVNGRYAEAFSVLPAELDVSFFAKTQTFGPLSCPDRDPLTALNTALAADGAQVRVPAGKKGGDVLLVSLGQTDASVSFHPRHSMTLEDGADLTLISIQAGRGRYLHNPVLEVSVGAEANLRHITLQTEGKEAACLATTYAQVAERGTYNSFVLGLGGVLSRQEIHARLAAPFATVHVNGAQMLGGRQIGDVTSVITHAAPDCISRQTVRNVLDGHARGVFQGKVYVDRVAQKTDGYQMNQALLLSENAEIDAKPELEIYADDVKCSHGATVGALDDDQLFYLRSRGVPEAEARQILIHAFLDEALGLIEDDVARTVCTQMLARSFPVAGENA